MNTTWWEWMRRSNADNRDDTSNSSLHRVTPSMQSWTSSGSSSLRVWSFWSTRTMLVSFSPQRNDWSVSREWKCQRKSRDTEFYHLNSSLWWRNYNWSCISPGTSSVISYPSMHSPSRDKKRRDTGVNIHSLLTVNLCDLMMHLRPQSLSWSKTCNFSVQIWTCWGFDADNFSHSCRNMSPPPSWRRVLQHAQSELCSGL